MKRSARHRMWGDAWIRLPQFARPVAFLAPIIAIAVIVFALAGCATLSEVRPWAGIELFDENTRAALVRLQDQGRLWLGFKATF